MKVSKTYRLTEEAHRLISLLSNKKGVAPSAVVELAVRDYAMDHNLVILPELEQALTVSAGQRQEP